MKSYKVFLIIISILSFIGISCKKNSPDSSVNCLGVDVFSLSDDRKLGMQADSEITANPATYPLLDSVKYAPAYAFIKNMRDNILNSGKVVHKNDFPWKVKIIHNDSTLNAFCTPGGYIYIYTGIIKYLDREDQLAGVLGHEMGHADNRHSTKALSAQVGEQTLAQLLGANNAIVNVAAQLANLKYSRCQEAQADEYSVIYLSGTHQYKCNGAAGFFEKLTATGQGASIPVFLSDHPGDKSRIHDINAKAVSLGCDTTYRVSTTGYAALKAGLP